MSDPSVRALPPLNAPERLGDFIQDQAEWRRSQARRFPDDSRNLRSAAALDELALEIAKRPHTHRLFDQLDRLGGFAANGDFRGGPLARKALARYRFDDQINDVEQVLFELVVAIAEENATTRRGNQLEIRGPRGLVVVNLAPERSAAPDGGPVQWIDPDEIGVAEAHVRVDQERELAGVLALFDDLTGLFVPDTTEKVALADARIAALVALESGLFGHVRSARAALVDGRLQDVVATSRTIEEILKKATVAIADAEFAARLAANDSIKMKDVDDAYAKIQAAEGRTPSSEQQAVRRGITDKSSWIIHARHQGLQFLAVAADDGGSLVTRMPAATQMGDRGRDLGMWVLAIAGDAVLRIVPVLLSEFGIADTEWRRRERAWAERFETALVPNLLRRRIVQREPQAKVIVDARGQLLEDGRAIPIEEATRRAGLADPNMAPKDRDRISELLKAALSNLRRWRADRSSTDPLSFAEDQVRAALEIPSATGYAQSLDFARRSLHLLRTGARDELGAYGAALNILEGIVRELEDVSMPRPPNWFGGLPVETLIEMANDQEGEIGRLAGEEVIRRAEAIQQRNASRKVAKRMRLDEARAVIAAAESVAAEDPAQAAAMPVRIPPTKADR